MKQLILGATCLIMIGTFSGCETISEEDCQIGAWGEYGYKDGLNGRSSARIAKYAEKCGKVEIKPDKTAYLEGYDQGVRKYCTYERGYERGERGESYNQVCSGDLAVDFAPGYDAGRVVYEIYQEHKSLVSRYDDRIEALNEVERRLREEEMDDKERKRLKKKARRLDGEADDLRIDIRAFERIHNLPRQDLY